MIYLTMTDHQASFGPSALSNPSPVKQMVAVNSSLIQMRQGVHPPATDLNDSETYPGLCRLLQVVVPLLVPNV